MMQMTTRISLLVYVHMEPLMKSGNTPWSIVTKVQKQKGDTQGAMQQQARHVVFLSPFSFRCMYVGPSSND